MARASYLTSARHGAWRLATGRVLRRHVAGFYSAADSSHAQRDVIERTILEAAIRAGNKTIAESLVQERLSHRPNSTYNQQKGERIALMN